MYTSMYTFQNIYLFQSLVLQ